MSEIDGTSKFPNMVLEPVQILEVLNVFREFADDWAGSENVDIKPPAYDAALAVSAALITGIGADAKRIAKITGIDGRTTAKFGRRLETAGLWADGMPTYEMNEDMSEMQMAALVADGLVAVQREESRLTGDS